jgi:hypothetical protein
MIQCYSCSNSLYCKKSSGACISMVMANSPSIIYDSSVVFCHSWRYPHDTTGSLDFDYRLHLHGAAHPATTARWLSLPYYCCRLLTFSVQSCSIRIQHQHHQCMHSSVKQSIVLFCTLPAIATASCGPLFCCSFIATARLPLLGSVLFWSVLLDPLWESRIAAGTYTVELSPQFMLSSIQAFQAIFLCANNSLVFLART